jgi:hypothetical protein
LTGTLTITTLTKRSWRPTFVISWTPHQSLQKSSVHRWKPPPSPRPSPAVPTRHFLLAQSLAGEGEIIETGTMRLLVKALDEEESLDFSRVELERKQLVERLVGKLSAGQIQDLVAKSVDYRAGRVGYGDYHNHLKKMCVAHGIKFSEWPQLNRYLSYVLLADKIDRNELLNEMEALDRSIPERLARNEKERQLVAVAFDLSLVAKLLRHEMSVTDWTAYESRMGEIHRLAARLTALDSSVKVKGLTAETLKPYEDFCFYASRRNNALTDNLLRQMADTKGKSAVLVAGGFHTEGLSALLRKKQVSYVVVTPKISAIPKDNDYLDVMANDPLPLEKQLAGDRIYLAKAIGMANSEGMSARTIAGLQKVAQLGQKFVDIGRSYALTTDSQYKGATVVFHLNSTTPVYLVTNYKGEGSLSNLVTATRKWIVDISKRVMGEDSTRVEDALLASTAIASVALASTGLPIVGAALFAFSHVWKNLARDLKKSGAVPQETTNTPWAAFKANPVAAVAYTTILFGAAFALLQLALLVLGVSIPVSGDSTLAPFMGAEGTQSFAQTLLPQNILAAFLSVSLVHKAWNYFMGGRNILGIFFPSLTLQNKKTDWGFFLTGLSNVVPYLDLPKNDRETLVWDKEIIPILFSEEVIENHSDRVHTITEHVKASNLLAHLIERSTKENVEYALFQDHQSGAIYVAKGVNGSLVKQRDDSLSSKDDLLIFHTHPDGPALLSDLTDESSIFATYGDWDYLNNQNKRRIEDGSKPQTITLIWGQLSDGTMGVAINRIPNESEIFNNPQERDYSRHPNFRSEDLVLKPIENGVAKKIALFGALIPAIETGLLLGTRTLIASLGVDPTGGLFLLSMGLLFSLTHVIARIIQNRPFTAGEVLWWMAGGALFTDLLGGQNGWAVSFGVHAVINSALVGLKFQKFSGRYPLLSRWIETVPYFSTFHQTLLRKGNADTADPQTWDVPIDHQFHTPKQLALTIQQYWNENKKEQLEDLIKSKDLKRDRIFEILSYQGDSLITTTQELLMQEFGIFEHVEVAPLVIPASAMSDFSELFQSSGEFINSLTKNDMALAVRNMFGFSIDPSEISDTLTLEYIPSTGEHKHVFKARLSLVNSKTQSIYIPFAILKEEKELEIANEHLHISDQEWFDLFFLKSTLLVPRVGLLGEMDNGRRIIIEPFIEGETITELQKNDRLTNNLRQKTSTTLFSIAYKMNDQIPFDAHGGNFVYDAINQRMVMVDIGEFRADISADNMTEAKMNLMTAILKNILLDFGDISGRNQSGNHALLDGIILADHQKGMFFLETISKMTFDPKVTMDVNIEKTISITKGYLDQLALENGPRQRSTLVLPYFNQLIMAGGLWLKSWVVALTVREDKVTGLTWGQAWGRAGVMVKSNRFSMFGAPLTELPFLPGAAVWGGISSVGGIFGISALFAMLHNLSPPEDARDRINKAKGIGNKLFVASTIVAETVGRTFGQFFTAEAWNIRTGDRIRLGVGWQLLIRTAAAFAINGLALTMGGDSTLLTFAAAAVLHSGYNFVAIRFGFPRLAANNGFGETEKTAEAIVEKINTTTDPTEKMALNAVVGDLMMKGRVSGMNLKRVSGGSAYWTQQDLVQMLMGYGDGRAVEALQSSEAKSNALTVLAHLMVQEGQGPGARMLLDFMRFNSWEKEVQETAKSMIEGLTKAGQPVLLLHDGTGDTNAVLAKLGITLNSTQMDLIDTQDADPGITMTQVVMDYNARTSGKGVPLASTVLVQNENSIQMDLKGFQLQKYSDLSKAIQKALDAMIAVLQAA